MSGLSSTFGRFCLGAGLTYDLLCRECATAVMNPCHNGDTATIFDAVEKNTVGPWPLTQQLSLP